MIEIPGSALQDFELASGLEWLETNGVGGWASSTVSGTHSRRYHGLLVAALAPPVRRTVLVSKLDETVRVSGAAIELGCNRYPGVVHPTGYRHLRAFRRDIFPELEFEVAGVRLRKTIAAIDGENTTVVAYEVDEAPAPFELALRPFLTWRDFHSLGPGGLLSDEVSFADGELRYRPVADGPEVVIRVADASFAASSDWFRNFEYDVERKRGLDFVEDLWTPGELTVRLRAGDRVGVMITIEPEADRDPIELMDRERRRREDLVARLPAGNGLVRALTLAADQFVVRRGRDLRTVIAGYHWFADWGRDTMIALPGLSLTTGRHEEAAQILRAFAASVDRGMLPNRFPDDGEAPEYNTVDATLWFFVAIHRYLEASGDEVLVRDELLPKLRDIIDWHDRGTRHGIRVDDDGLLLSGEPGVQLTWMDAKIGDWVVTPRHGKAVEINALWCNALRILAELESRFGRSEDSCRLRERAAQATERFARVFWNPGCGCLYDVVGDGWADDSIRPNQILALALPYPLLSDARARRVLSVVESHLLTPYGLRSLSPTHPDYRPVYEGDPLSRDSAYHQGTVWAWLLGPYLTALVRCRPKRGRDEAMRIVERAADHLRQTGVGSFSEIFDGDPPHTPRGCIAQAWSISELLRVVVDELEEV